MFERYNNYIAERVRDGLPPDFGLGSLSKAMLQVFERGDSGVAQREFHFFLNPNSVQVSIGNVFKQESSNQDTRSIEYGETTPRKLCLGEMWFDTYDTRRSVRRAYIDDLERLVKYDKETHTLPYVALTWGNFTHDTELQLEYVFHVEKLSVDYTLFLTDATPVRAKVSMELTEAMSKTRESLLNPKESPDHAKRYVVKQGDSLAGIAYHAYRDPREWRRIADANGISRPMVLEPGRQLLLPPILA